MKVLITGGTGTIGRAYVKNYSEFFDVYSLSRDENKQTQLSRAFPEVIGQYLGNVEDKETVFRVYEEVKPDIVIHAAAVKHINLAEQKYSLVYYLSVGDQNCSEPGILKLYDPSDDILPCEGMIVIIPAGRRHSAVYGGEKDRVIIGINFYSL